MARLMFYNIYRGGEGRLDKIVEVVNEARPDFLGVLEAIGWGVDDGRTIKQFSTDTNLPYLRPLIDPSAHVILMGDFNSLSPHDPSTDVASDHYPIWADFAF